MMEVLSELSQQLLNKLLKGCNKADGIKCVKIKITPGRFNGYHTALNSDRLTAHKELEKLAALSDNAFTIQYVDRGFDAVPILEKLSIVNPEKFLNAVGVTPKINILEKHVQKVKSLFNTAPNWLKTVLIKLPEHWIAGCAYKGISPKHLEKLTLAVRLASWLEASGTDACDYRTASVQALGNSKLLEKNYRGIAKIFAHKHPEYLSTLSAHEVLETFGLSRWVSELKIRGECSVPYPEGDMHIKFARPYISLEITELSAIHCDVNPRYVLMIENLTTFKRYTQEINDDGLVIYTGGFPSSAWVRLIKPLVANLASKTPIFHWGDIDIGGYRILAFLTQALESDIIPYCMSDVTTSVTGDVLDINKLQQALGKNLSGQRLKLSGYLEEVKKAGKVLKAVEQESIAVNAPSLNTLLR